MLMQDSKDDETLSWVLLAGMIEQSKKGAQKLSLRTKPCCVAFQISVNELYSDLVFFCYFCKMKFKNFFSYASMTLADCGIWSIPFILKINTYGISQNYLKEPKRKIKYS